MPTLELTIQPRITPPLPAVAWYVSGRDSAKWLEEIASWPVDHSLVRLIAIRDTDGAGIDGVLAIPNSVVFTPRGKCVAFGCVNENVYLPADAEIGPMLSVREIEVLFSRDYLFVWMPGRGLTAAEPADVLSLDDLLLPPKDAGIAWDKALPGIAFPQRLVALLPDSPPTLEDFIRDGRDDIGERSEEITKLPKSPGEPMSGVAGKAMRVSVRAAALPMLGVGKLFTAIGKSLSIIGRGAQQRGESNKTRAAGSARADSDGSFIGEMFSNIANKLMEKVSKALEKERHKEIIRLLNMLDDDPDQGLKYAIPFGGEGSHRGRATPTGQLAMRKVDFNLVGLGGGGEADFWSMSPEYQERLLTKYRELAAREARLGRFRRAAYIYAELLGDLRSAASTLEQGGHYREAAVLYREKLGDKASAAVCLERGELWHEAIDAYLELGQHEKVGDLYSQIEQQEAAAEAYHTVADELVFKQDLLGAARIYEEKLNDPRQAVETLDAGWPHAPQAKQCVAASFALRGRNGWHDEAQSRIQELCEVANHGSRHADVAELLTDVFKDYPESKIREASRTSSRNLIANRMRDASRNEAARLTILLANLDAGDRLMLRDGIQYVKGMNVVDQKIPPPAVSRHRTGQLTLVRQYNLGLPGVWQTAIRIGECFVAAGVMEGRVVVACADDSGKVEKNLRAWSTFLVESYTPVVMQGDRSPLRLFAIGGKSLPEQRLFVNTDSMRGGISAGTPRGLDDVWGAAAGKTGQTWAITFRDDTALVCVDSSGAVIATHSILQTPWSQMKVPVPMHVVGDKVLLGFGDELMELRGSRLELVQDLPRRIISLCGGSPYAAPLVAAAMETGVVLMRLGFESSTKSFAMDLSEPTVLLSPGGFLVAADETAIELTTMAVLKSNNAGRELHIAEKHDTGRPIALLSSERTNQFTIVTEQGTVSTYEVTS